MWMDVNIFPAWIASDANGKANFKSHTDNLGEHAPAIPFNIGAGKNAVKSHKFNSNATLCAIPLFCLLSMDAITKAFWVAIKNDAKAPIPLGVINSKVLSCAATDTNDKLGKSK